MKYSAMAQPAYGAIYCIGALVAAVAAVSLALEKEIFIEEEKIKIEQNVLALEQKLEQGMDYFNNLLRQAVQVLNSTAYPADAAQNLSQARMGLREIMAIIVKMKSLEGDLVKLTKGEKNLLNDDKKKA